MGDPMANRIYCLKAIYLLLMFSVLGLLGNQTIFGKGSADLAKLVVSSRLYSVPSEQQFLIDEIFPEFENQNRCKIRFEILDDDALLKRARFQVMTGNVKTDVVIVHSGRMAEWVRQNYVVPLPIRSWSGRTFSKAFRTSISYNGKTYFAPVGGDVYLLCANVKGLKYLPVGANLQELTWAEYVAWAVNMARGEGEGKTAVTGVAMKSLIYMYGGMFLSFGSPFPSVNSPGALKGWRLLVQMKDAYTPTVMTYDNIIPPMKSGEAWLTVAHMARVGEVFSSNPSAYVIAPAPSGSAGIGSIAGTSGFAVMKGAENSALAIKFIEYMTRPAIAVKIARGTGGFLPPIDEAIALLGNSPADEVIKKGITVLKTGVVSGVPAGEYRSWKAVKQVYDDIFKTMILGKGKVDIRYLNAAQERIDRLKR